MNPFVSRRGMMARNFGPNRARPFNRFSQNLVDQDDPGYGAPRDYPEQDYVNDDFGYYGDGYGFSAQDYYKGQSGNEYWGGQ